MERLLLERRTDIPTDTMQLVKKINELCEKINELEKVVKELRDERDNRRIS